MSARGKIVLISAVTAMGLAIASVFVVSKNNNRGVITVEDASNAIDASTLTKAAGVRVFFGHQSVGANLLDGIQLSFESEDVPSAEIVEIAGPEATSALPAEGGVFAHTFIGENGDPDGKLEAFDAMMRSGLADRIDVALLKFCYLDVTSVTDVDALFADYQATLQSLERDFPDVRFIHVTAPLTTGPGVKSKVKSLLRGGTNPVLADNAARERFNEHLRAAYGSDSLFDLAAFESTAPDGSTLSGEYKGDPYFTLYDGYALDEGHLDSASSQVAASELLTLIASNET